MLDVHLKYICVGCQCEHWISLKENQTKDFKIVCYNCDIVIEPVKISKIDILYKNIEPKTDPKSTPKINPVVEDCVSTLVDWGFDKKEARELTNDAIIKYGDLEALDLVKKIFFDYGALQNELEATEV